MQEPMIGRGTDPRGPMRTITKVERHTDRTDVTLDCGHVRQWNQIYTYTVGNRGRCFACRQEVKS